VTAGRLLLALGTVLLLTTAAIHAAGQSMVEGWTEALDHRQRMAICLVWITDSISWAVVALIWALAAWRQERGLLLASAVGALIPLFMFAGIMAIDPSFFGGWMLLASALLALAGAHLSRRSLDSARR